MCKGNVLGEVVIEEFMIGVVVKEMAEVVG